MESHGETIRQREERRGEVVGGPTRGGAAIAMIGLGGIGMFFARDALGSARLADALQHSLVTSLLSTVLVSLIGAPLAWHIVRGRRALISGSIIGGAALIPPSVIGVLASTIVADGWCDASVAIVMAQCVAATPFFVVPLAYAFARVNDELLLCARSLGATPLRVFFRVTLPQAWPMAALGLVAAWARAIGELGATVFVAPAGSALPVAILAAADGEDAGAARALAFIFCVLVGVVDRKRRVVVLGGRPMSARIDVQLRRPEGSSIAVALTIDAVTVLIGPRGAGKTTVLHLALGALCADAGHIALDGRVLFDSQRRVNIAIEDRRVAYIPRGLALFEHMSARANVEFAVRWGRADQRAREAERWLRGLGIERCGPRRPRELSGTERLRVALARAMATDPALLLFDEPLDAIEAPERAPRAPIPRRLVVPRAVACAGRDAG